MEWLYNISILKQSVLEVNLFSCPSISQPPGSFGPGDINGMIQEAIKMKDFEHPNVLGLIGVSVDVGESPYIVMPFMANGSLLSYLKKERANLTIAEGASEDLVGTSIESEYNPSTLLYQPKVHGKIILCKNMYAWLCSVLHCQGLYGILPLDCQITVLVAFILRTERSPEY